MRTYLIKKRDALLAASGLFWLPSGMSYDDVLAAYQFIGVGSEDSALSDVSGHGRTLTKYSQTTGGTTYTPTWNSSYGYAFNSAYQGAQGYLNNAALNTLHIGSVVVRFTTNSTSYDRIWLVTAGGDDGRAQITIKTAIWEDSQVKTYAGAGYVVNSGHWAVSNTERTEGVLGANFGSNSQLYFNGSVVSTSYKTADTTKGDGTAWHTFGNVHAAKSDLNNAVHGGKRIQAAVFFSRALSADEHLEVAQRMLEL